MRNVLWIIGAVAFLYYALQPPIHMLDFVMYFVSMAVILGFLKLIGGREFTEELGGLVGMLVLFIATIIYVALFVFGGVDWIDIFRGSYHAHFFDWFKL